MAIYLPLDGEEPGEPPELLPPHAVAMMAIAAASAAAPTYLLPVLVLTVASSPFAVAHTAERG